MIPRLVLTLEHEGSVSAKIEAESAADRLSFEQWLAEDDHAFHVLMAVGLAVGVDFSRVARESGIVDDDEDGDDDE